MVTLWLAPSPLIENNDIVCFSLIKNGDSCAANEVDLKQFVLSDDNTRLIFSSFGVVKGTIQVDCGFTTHD